MHRYFDISHYRAPYKNSVLSGYGQDAETPHAIPTEDSGIFERAPTDSEWDAMLATAKAKLENALTQAKSSEEAQAIRAAIQDAKETVAVQKASAAIADVKEAVAPVAVPIAAAAGAGVGIVTVGVIGLAAWGAYRLFFRGGYVARPTFTQNRRRRSR